MTTSAPQKVQTPWLGSQSPADAATKMDFGLSSLSTSSRRESFTLAQKDDGIRSDYGLQRQFLEASTTSSNYNINYERSAVQPLPNLGLHSRVLSEPSFPSPIGRHTNLLRSDHSILHSKNISIPAIADHHGSDLFSTTIRSSLGTSQTFGSFLDGEQHHDSIPHHQQGGSGLKMSSAMPASSNSSKYHESEVMEGVGGINLSPPINRTTISEDCAKQFSPTENGLSSSTNNFFGEDYSPSGKFLLESPYRSSTNKDGYLRSRAFSSPGPIEFSQVINQGLYTGEVNSESPTVPWPHEYSPRSSNKIVTGSSHHIRSHTMGNFPGDNDGQHQFTVDSFRRSTNTNDDTKDGSPKWQNLTSAHCANITPSRAQPQRLLFSKGDVQQLPLSRALSQSSYSSKNLMSSTDTDQTPSFGHVVSQVTFNNGNNHRIPVGLDHSKNNVSDVSRTPRTALYYPEKEDHFGQMDHDRSFQNNEQQHHHHHHHQENVNEVSSHLSNPLIGFNNNETAVNHNSPNVAITNPSVHSHMCMPGYGFQRHLASPTLDVYSSVQQQQQMNYQPQQMQTQMMPPYLLQHQMMQPMGSHQPHPPFNIHGGVLSPQQQQQQQILTLQHQQTQGMQQQGLIQGQRVFIPGMGTMIMSTTTGPDGESIGHLSFPLGVNSGGSPSNEAPPTMFINNIAPSQQQQSQYPTVNSGNAQGNMSNIGEVYHNMVIPQDLSIPSGVSSSLDAVHHVPPHGCQQNDVMTPQNALPQRVINVGSQSASPSSPIEDSSSGVITKDVFSSSAPPIAAQAHCSASQHVAHTGHLSQSKLPVVGQTMLPVQCDNNEKAGGEGTALTDATGAAAPNIVYNVKFKRTQRSFVLGPRAPREIKVGCYVKVEADRGEDLGIVISRVPAEKYSTTSSNSSTRPGFRGCSSEPPTAGAGAVSCAATDLKKVVRLATDEEISLLDDKRLEEDALLKICRVKVKQRGLNMNVVDAEYQFDRHKLIFFFEAEGRVDFRELVRDLFSIYKTRIWMQQLDKGGGSGVNSVGICTAIGDDLEEDVFCGVDQQDSQSNTCYPKE